MKATDGHTTPKLPVAAATSAAASSSDPDQDPLIVAMGGEPSAEEAEFIALCDELVEIYHEKARIFTTMPAPTFDEEDEREMVLSPLREKRRQIEDQLRELDVTPQTKDGINAAALAALATNVERKRDGAIDSDDLEEYLA